MAVVGDPGVGKTALLDETVAASTEMKVLRAVGVPAEEPMGYGALSVLLAPIRADVEALDARPRRALDSAFGRTDTPVEPLAVATAVVELLCAASIRRPLLLIVDDLQWVDADTRQVLGFVARRIAGQCVAIVLAARNPESLPYGSPDPSRLEALSTSQSRELLQARADDIAPDVAAVLADQCGGNPLVLLEAVARLSLEQRQGRRALDMLGPLPCSVARALRDRIECVDSTTQAALLLVVCEGQGDLQIIARLCGLESLEALQMAGLVLLSDGGIRLQHPLLAAEVLGRTPLREIQCAHATLAVALEPIDPDRAVWHRARSVVGPDDAMSAALTALARRQRRQGAPVAAAMALERAAELASGPRQRADLFNAAASEALDGGQPTLALGLVDRSEAITGPRPRGQFVKARLARLQGRYDESADLLGAAAAALDGTEQRDVLIERLWVAFAGGQPEVVRDSVERLQANGTTPDDIATAAAALLALDLRHPGVPLWAVARLGDTALIPPAADARPELLRLLALAANYSGNMALAESLELRIMRDLRLQGDALGAAEATSRAAFYAYHLGRWNAAEARCLDVDQLVNENFAPALVVEGLLLRADISASQGRAAACLEQCARLRQFGESLTDPRIAVLADRREAALEMGLQNWDAALALLRRSAAELARYATWHPYLSPAAELVEVLVRLGRLDDAAAAADDFLSRVGPGAPPQTRARALRIQGLLAPYGAAEELFTESAALDGEVGLLFLQARTQLCHGERLRRERQRSRAHAVLTEAATTFRRLGAAPWQARAEGEMSAGSAKTRKPQAASVVDLLTPRELQIAVLLSEGRRNKEICAAMFLSLRTVEFHLGNVYRKLDVTGRTQLVAYMSSS